MGGAGVFKVGVRLSSAWSKGRPLCLEARADMREMELNWNL